jgi:F5/8 type C domain-containing protein
VATSGTVDTYSFPVRKVIDHALRRAGYAPENTGTEWLEVAQDLLFLQLSEYVNAGFPLWTRKFILLGNQIGSPDVPTPNGTVDVISSYWRILNPYRGSATQSGGGDASALFGGQPNSDVVVAGPNPGVIVSFGSATEVDTIGVLLGGNAAITTVLNVLVSDDGVTFTQAQALPSATYTPGQWTYFDLNPSLTAPYVQLQYTSAGNWALNQLNFGLANGQDIENGWLNIDDYYNLPNKQFQSDRANSAFLDRQLDQPVIKIWPTPNVEAFYNGTTSALVRRYIQDPGSLTDTLEIPARWYEGVIARLGLRLMDTLPDPDQNSQASYFGLMAKTQRRQNLEGAATKAEMLMWAEERTHGPFRIAPSIRCYTS